MGEKDTFSAEKKFVFHASTLKPQFPTIVTYFYFTERLIHE